jgi:Gas vesicle synthesis protein GvpO
MTTREERAAGRQARRRETKPEEEPRHPSDAREAAREAATRALAAATVSAVRALASRATETEADESVSPEANQVPEPEASQPQPEPESEPVEREVKPRKPRKGADTGRIQDVIRAARDHLRELHQTDPESVSGLERTPNGWTVDLEVVEVRRIPESTDVLASYRVELDDRLDLLSYERTRRYHRAQADDGGRS